MPLQAVRGERGSEKERERDAGKERKVKAEEMAAGTLPHMVQKKLK